MKTHLLLLALTLAACGRTPQEISKGTDPSPQGQSFSFRADVREDPEPNRYRVDLAWEGSASPNGWTIQRLGGTHPVRFPVPGAEAKTFTDESAVAGEAYEYVLTSETPGQAIRFSAKAEIPKDKVIAGVEEAESLVGINRLFWRKTGELRPRGDRLRIVVRTLVAEPGARLRALPPEPAGLGQFGRTGPDLQLRAERASGELEVIADGQNGGPGLNGAFGSFGARGGKGADAQTRMGAGDRERCYNEAASGGRGSDGGPGQPGGAGGKGGDTAPVYIRVLQAADFRVNAHGTPGTGGPGGKGGPGGLGGPGGAAGAPNGFCPRVALPGPNGNAGPTGADGPKGKDGYSNFLCLKLGDTVHGSCPNGIPEPDWTRR